MNDRDLFWRNILRQKEDGLRSLQAGVNADQILAGEISSPRTDVRYGVNLVCRPPARVVRQIASIQEYLRAAEPGQYYYPVSDLHLTLVEFCHSRSAEEAEHIAARVRPKLNVVLANAAPPRVDSPTLVFNSTAVALNFLPIDTRLQNLRRRIFAEVSDEDFSLNSRYMPISAHITLMRYTRPLRTSLNAWMERLENYGDGQELAWSLKSMWLTWGANWYGMRSRIKQVRVRRVSVGAAPT